MAQQIQEKSIQCSRSAYTFIHQQNLTCMRLLFVLAKLNLGAKKNKKANGGAGEKIATGCGKVASGKRLITTHYAMAYHVYQGLRAWVGKRTHRHVLVKKSEDVQEVW